MLLMHFEEKESELINTEERYSGVLDILLKDHTTKKNIFWATNNYEEYGKGYEFKSEILPELITGKNINIIIPRVYKNIDTQQIRVRDMAEVFTPSWVCNKQNNLIDNAWFGYDNVFNTEIIDEYGKNTWITNKENIVFKNGKTWKDYVKDTRLEITCGEAPYLTSRYDTTTGEFIPVENRIGLLDRKLRIINENVHVSGEWLEFVQLAYKSIYGFEWQGDNLLLARESLLYTFIDNYIYKFGKKPLLKSIKYIAYIISWNIWQMDGLKGVLPETCKEELVTDLFGNQEKIICNGCKTDNIYKHNGIYALIKDWNSRDSKTGKNKIIRFIDLLKK